MQWWLCCRPVLKLRLCLGWGDSFPYFVLYLPSYFINFYILGNFMTQNLTRYQNIIDVLILNKYQERYSCLKLRSAKLIPSLDLRLEAMEKKCHLYFPSNFVNILSNMTYEGIIRCRIHNGGIGFDIWSNINVVIQL